MRMLIIIRANVVRGKCAELVAGNKQNPWALAVLVGKLLRKKCFAIIFYIELKV